MGSWIVEVLFLPNSSEEYAQKAKTYPLSCFSVLINAFIVAASRYRIYHVDSTIPWGTLIQNATDNSSGMVLIAFYLRFVKGTILMMHMYHGFDCTNVNINKIITAHACQPRMTEWPISKFVVSCFISVLEQNGNKATDTYIFYRQSLQCFLPLGLRPFQR